MSPRRLRLWIIAGALVGIPVVGVLVGYIWINRVADRRWAAAESRIRQLSAAYPERDSRREPEKVSEAAKENQIHFVAAIRLAAPKRLQRDEAWRLIFNLKSGDQLDPVLDDAQDFLDRLHQGARRIAASPAEFPPRWHGDWDVVTLTYMLHCGVLRSRQQRWRKAPDDAAETLLDVLQLGRFWAISGKEFNRAYSVGYIVQPLEELRDLISSESLSPDQLRSLERELEPLGAALRSPIFDLGPELARWAETLEPSEVEAEGGVWGWMLPARFVKAEAVEFLSRSLDQLQDAQARGASEVRSCCRRIYDEAKDSRNPIVKKFAGLGYNLDWSELERKAQLNLLRAAAHYRATGELSDLPDPFGTVIHHADDGTRMRFWSLGYSGVDDRGQSPASWTQGIPVPGVVGRLLPKNIVIEVPRRP